MTRFIYSRSTWLLVAVVITVAGSALASTSSAIFEREHVKLRYNLALGQSPGQEISMLSSEFAADDPSGLKPTTSYKSPAKAFLLSLAVPGLGQYYYGSRVKPFVFFGAEVAAWALYFHFHSEGERITDEFEAFNRAHWSPERYEDYLFYVYGVRDDDSVPSGTTEVSHHLPDEMTQQYYEMTGKYDQFSWGWDDASLDGHELDSTVVAVVNDETTPSSARRFFYETTRDKANTNFDNATRMVIFSMANRVISAFEALFTTRNINKKAKAQEKAFGNIKIKTRLRSYYAYGDTPYITATFKF